jgi:NAD-dependent SIR2 family protein deacetylase
MVDALALIREHEPVEPVPEHSVVVNTLACGACHAQVARWDMFPRMSRDAKRVYLFRAKYCPECGRKVKWEGK